MTLSQRKQSPEPWLRGTNGELPAVARATLHALELAKEDIDHWCSGLSEEQFHARPFGIEPVAFHLRHIARSVDRLLTYAEGGVLVAEQTAALQSESASDGKREELLAEWNSAFQMASKRLKLVAGRDLEAPKSVGVKRLPTTLGGLIVHIADHTQRHVGQLVTTVKMVRGGQGDL